MADPYRDGVLARDAWRSARSGEPVTPWDSCHHRKLKGQGGKDTPENRVMLTGSGTTGDHGWVHANPAEAKRLGWLVPSWADPAAWPMWSEPRRSWVLLTPAGGVLEIPAPPGDDAANWTGERDDDDGKAAELHH